MNESHGSRKGFACTLGGWGLPLVGALLGGAAGAVYSLTIGCVTGGCPITSNAWLMGGVVALIGLSVGRDYTRSRSAGCAGKDEQQAIEQQPSELEQGESRT